MKNWYKDLQQRFLAFDTHIQMLNMVSDLVKAKNMSESNPDNASENCLRAIILLDFILSDPRWESRRNELYRLREVIASLTTTDPLADYDQAIRAALSMDTAAYRLYYHVN